MTATLAYILCAPGIPLAGFFVWLTWFSRKARQNTRFPFEEMPRPAGWSLQNRTADLTEKAQFHLIFGLFSGLILGFAAYFAKTAPAISLVIGMAATSGFLVHSARLLKRWRNHRLGLLGEQVVGKILDQLASDTVKVFHDLEVKEPGKATWNIDHVIVTPAGVFALETKTRRKTRIHASDGQKSHKVIFDGQQLRFPAPMSASRNDLEQVRRNAKWLSGNLTALNACPIPVTPVLVLPGWWVEATGKGPVTALNPKQLPGFLKGRTPTLSPEHQRSIAAQLEERTRIDLSRPS